MRGAWYKKSGQRKNINLTGFSKKARMSESSDEEISLDNELARLGKWGVHDSRNVSAVKALREGSW